MKNVDFYLFVQETLEDCLEIMHKKGDAYAGEGQDKFANFNRIAEKRNIQREDVLMIYTQKHLDAIDSFLRGEYNDPEPIQGRINDVINYFLILAGMIRENTNRAIEGKMISNPIKMSVYEHKHLMGSS